MSVGKGDIGVGGFVARVETVRVVIRIFDFTLEAHGDGAVFRRVSAVAEGNELRGFADTGDFPERVRITGLRPVDSTER